MSHTWQHAETEFEPSGVDVRVKLSALWTAMLFVFAYVDLFSLYRPDFRADLEGGQVGGFTVNQGFLLGVTVYVVVAGLMVFGALVLRPRINRVANIGLGLVYGVTIIAGAIGEWTYYVLGSIVEVVLLAAIVYHAWTWPKETSRGPGASDEALDSGQLGLSAEKHVTIVTGPDGLARSPTRASERTHSVET